MGFISVYGGCISCGRAFTFSPTKVPSVIVKGQREPICRFCVERANPARVAKGLAPIQILPGAYEGDDEGGM